MMTRSKTITRTNRSGALAVIATSLVLAVSLLLARPAHAATFTVTNTNDSGAGSLRQAILDANDPNNPGADTIKFNIPSNDINCDATTNVCTISPTSALPKIADPLTIDGYSQPGSKPNTLAVGNNAKLMIELSGAGAGSGTVGLEISAANSTVKGLIINSWSFYGVRNSGSEARGNKVMGNYIGTDASGTKDLGNSLDGVFIFDAPNNTIGGTTAGARNIISGNDSSGVFISGADATGNKVMGNYIGTKANGIEDLGNSGGGVQINGAPDNTIGGTTARARNIISGNDGIGVVIGGANAKLNKVQGNYVGTDKTGTLELGNSSHGVSIGGAPDNTVGGTEAGARNIISGNGERGVVISGAGATSNEVMGNYIGTDKKGTADLGNSGGGVIISGAPDNTIGGTTARARNIISGNSERGVGISGSGATGNEVMGNYIGTDKNGTADLGNSFYGVAIVDVPNNTIGGTEAGTRNIIFSNGFDGVFISGANATGNRILRNSIHDSGLLGIELSASLNSDGVTANDAGDGDTGPNNLQNFPELSSATKTSKKTTIVGMLNSTANTTFTVQFFSSPTADFSGNGEGKKFLGELTGVTTDASGDASFTATTPAVAVGQVVTATATNKTTGDTSEFSLGKQVL